MLTTTRSGSRRSGRRIGAGRRTSATCAASGASGAKPLRRPRLMRATGGVLAMGMAKVLPEIPVLKASYATGHMIRLPVNITVSVSYRCNSRCKTCNVWLLPNDDLTLPEWARVFESLGSSPYWFTFSGGEPTLRKDLPDMVQAAYRHCRPGIINIPTNGIQDKIIPARIERVLQAAPTSDVIINLSLDGVGEKHDIVRGVKGNFE